MTLGFCTEYEIRGLLQTDENGTVLGGDTGDWCYENGGLAGNGIVYPAYPNPAYPSSALRVDLATSTFVTIRIINDRCQDVRTLISEILGAGTTRVLWNGDDDEGKVLPDGIYGVIFNIDGSECHGDIERRLPTFSNSNKLG